MTIGEISSAVAVAVALLALVLGELRAWSARRARTERNVIDWDITWGTRDEIFVTNMGPDTAKRVLVKLTIQYFTVEAEAKRMSKGEVLRVAVPHIAATWDEAANSPVARGEMHIAYQLPVGARITWNSPRGTPQMANLSSSIAAPRPHLPDGAV